MTLAEKIATVPKLERIDSSIESCIKILEQELSKRKVAAPDWEDYTNQMLGSLGIFKDDFNVMKVKSNDL